MSEEILKVQLSELLRTVRFKRKNGTVLEASDMDGVRDCCAEIRDADSAAGAALFDFFNLAARLTEKTFPVQVEFAINSKEG